MDEHAVTTELIRQAVAGDRVAFQRLILGYWDRLARRIARKIPLSLQSRISEEDVIQDALLEAARAIGTFEPIGPGAFFRWLARIADRRLQDAIKAHRTLKRGGGFVQRNALFDQETSTVDDLVSLLAGAQGTPSQVVARDEALQAVQLAVASLKDEYRTVIQLRYVQGLAVEKVAEAMETTRPAIHNLTLRAMRELRIVMGTSSQFFTKP